MRIMKCLAVSGLLLAGLALNASPALAINNTCADREAMLVGSTENWSIAASSSAYFATRLQAGRSYVFLAWTPFEDAGEGGGTVSLTLYSDVTCTTVVSVTDVETREPFSNLGAADIDAFAYIPTATGQFVFRVANGETRAVSHRILIYETSLYSPWWFTNGNTNAFVILSNRSNLSTSVTVTLNTGAGVQCGTTTVVVPANGNTAIVVNTFPTCLAAVSGSAQIAFLSTPGTIQANTTVIDGVQGISFDEPFQPRMVWSMTER